MRLLVVLGLCSVIGSAAIISCSATSESNGFDDQTGTGSGRSTVKVEP